MENNGQTTDLAAKLHLVDVRVSLVTLRTVTTRRIQVYDVRSEHARQTERDSEDDRLLFFHQQTSFFAALTLWRSLARVDARTNFGFR